MIPKRFNNEVTRRALRLGVPAIALALTVFSMGGTRADAAESETQTADRKGLRSNGKASSLQPGKLTLKYGRHAYFRFRVPASWDGSRVLLVFRPGSSSTKGLSVRRASVTWKGRTPVKAVGHGKERIRSGALTRGTQVKLDVTSLLATGISRTLKVAAIGNERVTLRRMPYLLRYNPSTTVAAVGDIACSPESSQWNGGAGTATECRQADVAKLISAEDDAVLLLGDVQYPDGTLTQFQTGFGPSWGSLANRMRPTPGNHEYYTPGASGYYDYFESLGIEIGGAGVGYYAFDLGDWTFLSLNSNCSDVPCSAGSAQELWLREQLEEARNLDRCTLAYWHHPPASSGIHGDTAAVADLWRAFVDLGGDLLLAGHDHHYERFAPLSADLEPDSSGPPSWVIGTGGKSLRAISGTRAGSEKVIDDAFGLTRFRLAADSFDWEWVGLGNLGSDTGSADCRA